MRVIINRLSEPSTYAGLAGMAIILGYTMEEFTGYANALAGLFATAAAFMPEKSSD